MGLVGSATNAILRNGTNNDLTGNDAYDNNNGFNIVPPKLLKYTDSGGGGGDDDDPMVIANNMWIAYGGSPSDAPYPGLATGDYSDQPTSDLVYESNSGNTAATQAYDDRFGSQVTDPESQSAILSGAQSGNLNISFGANGYWQVGKGTAVGQNIDIVAWGDKIGDDVGGKVGSSGYGPGANNANQGGVVSNFIDGFNSAPNYYSPNSTHASDLPSIMGLVGSATNAILKNGTAADQALGKIAGITTKALGGVGIGLTAINIYNQRGSFSNFTAGDWTKLAVQGVTFIPVVGEIYAIGDLGFGLFTGKSLTDRIGDGVDNAVKHW